MKKFFILLFFTASNIHGHNFVCISLGEVCSAAAALNTFELRTLAYPFDWVISSFDSLYKTIQDDFQDYLNPSYFQLRHDNHGVINKYGVCFVHDFLTNNYTGNNLREEEVVTESILSSQWFNTLPDVQSKYARRIDRFLKNCLGNEKVYFIRHLCISRQQAIELRNLIQQKYPQLDFVLVVVANSDYYFHTPWGEEKIKNYSLNGVRAGYSLAYQRDIQEWTRVFTDLGIIAPQSQIDIQQKYMDNLCKNVLIVLGCTKNYNVYHVEIDLIAARHVDILLQD